MPVNTFEDHPLPWTPPRTPVEGPVYLAIAAAIEEDILSGALSAGAKLPPQRELADFLDIDFTTVTRAYNVCREKGLVYGVTGRGTFVASHPACGEGAGAVDCGVVQAFPETGAREMLDAARDVISRPSSAGLFSYRERDGSAFARSAGLAWLHRNGVDAKASQMAVFPGAQGALSAVLLSLFKVGDCVAVDEFTYANFISLARLARLRLVPVPSDEEGMSPDALEEAARKHRAKGVFLMPHCANPTARTLSARRMDALADVAAGCGLLAIEDDARLSLPAKGERTLFARLPGRTVHISGTTRYIAGGLRATFMAFPEKHARKVLDALHHLAIKAGALDAEILAETVASGRAARILAAKAAKAREANRIFDGVFPGAPRSDGEALFRRLPLPGTYGRGVEIERLCREGGVAVCHSDRFCVRPGSKDSFLRVSLSSAPSRSSLRHALESLAGVLSAMP
ncbi:MAG: PLP-dependent aminotransferase family protein [Kiritimatiellae bacterium]|nr:PLP-dependent aminotransferase family protein [Kiritimatiellia bacterium]